MSTNITQNTTALEELLETASNLPEGGGSGESGATFLPSVSSDGIISWTNNKNLPNPTPVNIKGADGESGKTAYQYAQEAGYVGTETDFANRMAQSIPDELADLQEDTTHRTVTDIEKSSWNAKANLSEVATYITPEQYGAIGDGVADDSKAIQDALDAAESMSTIYLGSKQYKINTGLVLTGSYKTVICDGRIVYKGEDVAFTVKNAYRCKTLINTIDASNGTALKLDATEGAVVSNDFTINIIRNCNIGIHLYTNGSHVSHNTLRNTYMSAKDTAIKVWADSYYINENLWYLDWINGEWQYGIYLHSDAALDNTPGFGVNDNKFYSGSLEGNNKNSIPLLIDRSYGNYFKELRLAEGYGATSVKMRGKCNRNDISLNHLVLSEVDISELEAGSVHNVLRCRGSHSDTTNYFIVGDEIRVSAAHGFTYIPDRYNYNINITANTFAENIITHVGTVIPTALTFDDSDINGLTFIVDGIYSDHGSMTRGFPLTVRFGEQNGRVLLNDNKGSKIIDNRFGEYDGKVISVKWAGFHSGLNKNIWECQEIDGNIGQINVTNLSQDVGFSSRSYGVVLETDRGDKYKIVAKDSGLLTTIPAEEINRVPRSIDENNNTFTTTWEGTTLYGCTNGVRISSEGELKPATNGTATGFIKVTKGQVVRFKGGRWETQILTNCVSYSTAEKEVVGYFTGKKEYLGICTQQNSAIIHRNDGLYEIVVPDDDRVAFIRISMYGANEVPPGNNMAVYVIGSNEETPIVESVNGQTGAIQGLATEEYVEQQISKIPTPDVSGQIEVHNTSDRAHEDIRSLVDDLSKDLSNYQSVVVDTNAPENTDVIWVDLNDDYTDELPEVISQTLAQAKASGEFDGADGNGIKSAVLNADYSLTLTFDNNASYTTPSIRGATGAAGKNGVSIKSIRIEEVING